MTPPHDGAGPSAPSQPRRRAHAELFGDAVGVLGSHHADGAAAA